MLTRYLIVLFPIFSLTICAPDYYWQDYAGVVLEDSVVGAENFGYNSYIGNAPFETNGLLPGELLPGIPTINITGWPGGAVHVVDTYVQILCSQNPDNFRWLRANYTTVKNVEGLVPGGFQTSPSIFVVYIGRVLINNIYKIGRVVTFYSNEDSYLNQLYIDLDDEQVEIVNYEVLVYVH